MASGEASGSGSVVPQLVLVAIFGVLLSSSGVACPSECHCLDHDSIVNCHHAGVDRLPSRWTGCLRRFRRPPSLSTPTATASPLSTTLCYFSPSLCPLFVPAFEVHFLLFFSVLLITSHQSRHHSICGSLFVLC